MEAVALTYTYKVRTVRLVLAVDTPRLSAVKATTLVATMVVAVLRVLVAVVAVLGQLVLTLRRAQGATVATGWMRQRFVASPQELPITLAVVAVRVARLVASAVSVAVETAKTRATPPQQEPLTPVVVAVATAPLVAPALS